MQKFEHRGIEIELLSTGQFRGRIGGKWQTSPSLAAIKKRIDKHIETKFEPIKAISVRSGRWNDQQTMVDVLIVGIETNGRRKYGRGFDFVFADGQTHHQIAADTPENRNAIKAYLKHKEETERIDEERSAQRKELEAKIQYLKADDIAAKQK